MVRDGRADYCVLAVLTELAAAYQQSALLLRWRCDALLQSMTPTRHLASSSVCEVFVLFIFYFFLLQKSSTQVTQGVPFLLLVPFRLHACSDSAPFVSRSNHNLNKHVAINQSWLRYPCVVS